MIPVNLITGQLGAGKTTLIRHLLEQKPPQENWALIVNEFGSVGIDNAILSESGQVSSLSISGGCICCTSQSEFFNTLNQARSSNPDRIIIEPTGLSEPDSLIDLLNLKNMKKKFSLQSVIAVLDSQDLTADKIHQYAIYQNLVNLADVIVLNKTDLATEPQVTELNTFCQALYPAKQAVITTQNAALGIEHLNQQHSDHFKGVQTSQPHSSPKEQCDGIMLPYFPATFPCKVERHFRNDLGTTALGLLLPNDVTFDWKALNALFQSFNQTELYPGLKRAKGVFKVGTPWMLFQWVNQQASREYLCYRRDSRVELLFENDSSVNFSKLEADIARCIQK